MKATRWLPAVVVAAALAALVMVVLVPDERPLPGGAERSALPTLRPPSSGAPTPAASGGQGTVQPALKSYIGPEYDVNFVTEPTESSVQSKLWFHDGSWWGVLSSAQTGQFQIHELDWASQRWVDRGVLVDERPFARLDVVSSGADLYVAAAGTRASPNHALRFRHFGYDAATRTYGLEPDFPRSLTPAGVTDASMALSADGRLWLAYIVRQRVTVTHSAPGGTAWVAPFIPPVDETGVAAERVALTSSDGEVAVVWTSLREDLMHAAIHLDGAPDTEWTVHSVPVSGLIYGEDQLSARATSDGTVFAAVRSSLDRVDNSNPDAAQIVMSRLDGATWTQAVVSRVRDGHASPYIVLDDDRNRTYVFAEAEGDIYLKHADFESLSFTPGLGERAIITSGELLTGASPSPTATATATTGGSPAPEASLPSMSRVTSTNQRLDGLTEIVIIASDDVSGRYGHGVVGLPDGRTPPAVAGHVGDPPAELAGGLPAGTTTYLFRDRFTPFAPGPATVTGWTTRDEPADEVLRVAEPTADDPSLRLAPNALGDGPRACKEFAPSSGGVLILRAAVQVRGVLDSDATISTFRSDAGEVASVRFGEPGVFRYFVGNERINSPVAYQPGVWYGSVLVLDFTTQTYDWTIAPIGGEPVLAVADVPLRIPAETVVEVCAQSGDQLPGGAVEMFLDDVSVARGPGG